MPSHPPETHSLQHETLVQRNLCNKVCTYCNRPGALLKCEGAAGNAMKLQQVSAPTKLGWREAARVAGDGEGGKKVATAAAAAGGGGGGSGAAAASHEV